MITFQDYYNNIVRLSFDHHPFSQTPKHVWVVCRYEGKWLLTIHKRRGLEFPGGKIEDGESPEAAARREVMEETGGCVRELIYLGQYEISGKSETIIKNIYYAEIEKLTTSDNYFETAGPVLIEHLPDNIFGNKDYSFMMKDRVLTETLKQIQKKVDL